MSSRIGTLHLRYRARGGGTLAAAMAPHLDRVLASRLAETIDERLAALLGDDAEVVVIREVTARVAVGRADWTLDSRLVDRVGRASIDAISDTVARPGATDAVVRFADQAEFIGSFILDLLAGSAWDRWYFGAFARYRSASAAETIDAILDDNRPHVAAVFGWLARRGRLDAVVALLGSERARLLADVEARAGDGAGGTADAVPLMAAGFELLVALGWTVDDEMRGLLRSEYLATKPLPPTWTDRRSLSAWVMRFVQFAAERVPTHGGARREVEPEATVGPLRGSLDWLDVAWLSPQLQGLAVVGTASSSSIGAPPRVLPAHHERALDRLAELVRSRRVRVDPLADRHAIAVQLLAALTGGDSGARSPDRALAAALDVIAHALHAAAESGLDGQRLLSALVRGARSPGALPGGFGALADRLEDVRAAGPAAVRVVQQLAETTLERDSADEETSAGGLFLLTRGLVDVKLHTLARRVGVPFTPLKGALAAWWFDQVPPFDAGAVAWIGEDGQPLSRLDAFREPIVRLQDDLLDLLRGQRATDALLPDDGLDIDAGRPFTAIEWSPDTARAIARVGAMVLCAWSRWLPGIGGSTRRFLVGNCLQRPARLRVTAGEIAVRLDPAPLDVVVEMAGYFRPIERVPWLGGRAVTFAVRRAARR